MCIERFQPVNIVSLDVQDTLILSNISPLYTTD